MGGEHGHAEGASDQMDSELDAITRRLRVLKQRLDARQSVYTIEQEPTPAHPSPLVLPARLEP